MTGVLLRNAGIRPQPSGSVSLRPGTPFTRWGGFAHIGGREELIGLPGRYATPNGNIVSANSLGESIWQKQAASINERTTYVSLGTHAAKYNGYTIITRARTSTYAGIQSVLWSSMYDSTDPVADGVAVGRVMVDDIRLTNYFATTRDLNVGASTVPNRQWHNVVFVCGRNPPTLGGEGTWYREVWVDGRLRGTARHPSITQTWGLSEIGLLGDTTLAASREGGSNMTFPELALFAISFENLRQEEAAAASRDPYGYLFGDRRIWVPVSVSDGSANISTAQQVDPFAQSALGDSVTGAVTLSNPGVTDVTATSAKPKVTVEF